MAACSPLHQPYKARRAGFVWLMVFFLAGILTACSGSQVTPYLPPTAVGGDEAAFITPQPAESASQVKSPALTATPACTNGLKYLQDLTIPDDSRVTAGSLLDKRWKVQNSGTCNWDERYRIKLISGADLGAEEQALFPARGGMELTIQILFTAPAEVGTYQSTWQAHDPQGNPFGDPFYIQVVVRNP